MPEINYHSFLVSAKGGTLDFVSFEGELLASISVPSGRIPVSDYWDLLPDGASVVVSDGLAVLNPRSAYGVSRSDGLYETGANPDYAPSSADVFQRRMSAIVSGLVARNDGLERRVASLANVPVMPVAPLDKREPLLLDVDDAKP